MDWRRAKPLERRQVFPDGIALVLREPVAWVAHIHLAHQRIARGLRQNGCRGNRQAFCVAPHDRLLRDREIPDTARVDKNVLRFERKAFDRAAHGQQPGPVNIDAVDLVDLGEADRPGYGKPLDLTGKPIARGGIEFFRVIDTAYARPWQKYNRRCRHRPCKRAHPGFINACDVEQAALPVFALKAQQLAQTLTLRALRKKRRRATASRMAIAPARPSAFNAASVAASSGRPSTTWRRRALESESLGTEVF